MLPEVNEKVGAGNSAPVSLTLLNIPRHVHNKLKKYRRKINNDRQADYSIKGAYVEFLKEAVKKFDI